MASNSSPSLGGLFDLIAQSLRQGWLSAGCPNEPNTPSSAFQSADKRSHLRSAGNARNLPIVQSADFCRAKKASLAGLVDYAASIRFHPENLAQNPFDQICHIGLLDRRRYECIWRGKNHKKNWGRIQRNSKSNVAFPK